MMEPHHDHARPWHHALGIAAIYLVAAGVWIAASDHVLLMVLGNATLERFGWISTLKGWVFVIVTAALLYWLIHRRLTLAEATRNNLRESRRALLTLMSNLPGMAYRCYNSRDWTMEFVSEGSLRLTGYEPAELMNNAVAAYGSIIHPDDREQVWQHVQEAVASHALFRITYRIIDKSGREKWVWEQGQGVFDADGQLVAIEGFIADITDRKRLEDQLVQSQKMEAIGRLAGGVAHDFNNLLAVIGGYSEALTRRLDEDDPLYNHAAEIQKAADRGAALIRQLLAFSRRQEIRPQRLDLNDVLAGLLEMLRRLLGKSIDVQLQASGRTIAVMLDPAQAEQVVINLALNARDAMPDGGTLTLRTAVADLDAAGALPLGLPAGRYHRLDVQDTGVGIDQSTQAKIFEPFFTTKEGKGTGLGLSIVYGIIHQAGGTVQVKSRPGHGATFTAWLPEAGEEPENPDSPGRREGTEEVSAG